MTDQPDFDRFCELPAIPASAGMTDGATSRHSHPAGRGWVPASRDIGLPNDPVRRRSREDQEDFAAGLAAGSTVEARDHRAFTAARQVVFCDHLSTTGNVRTACARVGIAPQTAYRTRRREAGFAAAWEGALLLARDHAEAVLACRALEGVDEPVFYHGEEVARRRRYDPRLLLAHLARLDARVEDDAAELAAERFDEVLAALGGHEAEPDLVELARRCEPENAVLGEGKLAARRETWARYHSDAAQEAAERAEFAPDAEPWDETGRDPILVAGYDAAEAAGAEWDAHFAETCAHVDAVCDGVPDESAEVLSDGSVTCVTLPSCNDGSAAAKAQGALVPETCETGGKKGCDYEAVGDGSDDGRSSRVGGSGGGSGTGGGSGRRSGYDHRGAGRDRAGRGSALAANSELGPEPDQPADQF